VLRTDDSRATSISASSELTAGCLDCSEWAHLGFAGAEGAPVFAVAIVATRAVVIAAAAVGVDARKRERR
jgi:hypothetical protein